MAAYLIGHITIKDPVKWEKYVQGVQVSLAPFWGENHFPVIVHNIGSGPAIEDMLFAYQITGHYRYYGKKD